MDGLFVQYLANYNKLIFPNCQKFCLMRLNIFDKGDNKITTIAKRDGKVHQSGEILQNLVTLNSHRLQTEWIGFHQ